MPAAGDPRLMLFDFDRCRSELASLLPRPFVVSSPLRRSSTSAPPLAHPSLQKPLRGLLRCSRDSHIDSQTLALLHAPAGPSTLLPIPPTFPCTLRGKSLPGQSAPCTRLACFLTMLQSPRRLWIARWTVQSPELSLTVPAPQKRRLSSATSAGTGHSAPELQPALRLIV